MSKEYKAQDYKLKYTSLMDAWYFSGFGNYSEDYDWFSGITAKVEHQVFLDDIYMDLDTTYGEWFNVEQLLKLNPVRQIFAQINAHGGSMNIDGVVLADNQEEAEALVKLFAEFLGLKEYAE